MVRLNDVFSFFHDELQRISCLMSIFLCFVELTHEFLQILEKTPSRLKRIRNWRVGYVSVLFHALERHC